MRIRTLNSSRLVWQGPFHSAGFSFVELLVVIGLIATLGALLTTSSSRTHERAQQAACASNLRQLGVAFALYAPGNDDKLPLAGYVIRWDSRNPLAWTRQLGTVVPNTNLFHCPDFSRAYNHSPFNYFMGARAAFVSSGAHPDAVKLNRVLYPSSYILSGDSNFPFTAEDADPDNFTQDTAFGRKSPCHSGTVNILFGDGHIVRADGFSAESMTFSYTEPSTPWEM